MFDEESSNALDEMRVEISEMKQELTLLLESSNEDLNIEHAATQDRCTAIESRLDLMENLLESLEARIETLEGQEQVSPELERRMAMMEKTLIYIYKASQIKK